MLSNLEELAKRYFMVEGYLVMENVLFFLPREQTGKRVSGWSDIDVLGYKKNKIAIVQCKEFLGTKSIECIVKDLDEWFNSAEAFLRSKHSPLKVLVGPDTQLVRFLVIGHEPSDTQRKRLASIGVNTLSVKDILVALISNVTDQISELSARGTGARGKELDLIRYTLKKMIEHGLISEVSGVQEIKQEEMDKVRIAVEHLKRKRARQHTPEKNIKKKLRP